MLGTPCESAGVPEVMKPQVSANFVGTPQLCTTARESGFAVTATCEQYCCVSGTACDDTTRLFVTHAVGNVTSSVTTRRFRRRVRRLSLVDRESPATIVRMRAPVC